MAEKMADNNAWRKKEAKRKAGPSGQKEKQRKEAESSERTKNTSEEGGQNTAQKEHTVHKGNPKLLPMECIPETQF
jgi:hypothetical protein